MVGSLVTNVLLMTLSASLPASNDIQFINRGSPWTKQRAFREHTRYIILHTTEGAERGALEKLSREGEAHYLVRRDGVIYRIVHHRRIATHTGLSMWEGITDLDNYALGVEIAGYHDSPPTPKQLVALKELLRQLQSIYDIPDYRVLTHSMVAYGTPNRWHRQPHRGRKRCAMQLAASDLRDNMGLTQRPQVDPDVASGRLIVADRRLHASLYPGRRSTQITAIRHRSGKDWDSRKQTFFARTSNHPVHRSSLASSIRAALVAAGILEAPSTTASSAKRTGTVNKPQYTSAARSSSTPSSISTSFSPRRALSNYILTLRPGENAKMVVGEQYRARTTIYLFPDGLVRTGAQLAKKPRLQTLLRRPPAGTRILVNYYYGGYITARRSPSIICGDLWDDATTIYRLPNGDLRTGDAINADHIPRGTLIFFRARR
ncbi:MAG: N-acetylmuramoyl-L-alanine amidase [Myxococcales bacterium]|nr:N-acetylmuramoyl-L-alanine amidase [Myxococcales bacterium]